MKASEAFFTTLTWVMSETNRFCGFGYQEFDTVQGPISAVLYGIGKIARYTLGFAIGIGSAVCAYSYTVLKNWFNYEEFQPINKTEMTQPKPPVKSQSNASVVLKKLGLEYKIRVSISHLDSEISDLKWTNDDRTSEEKAAEYLSTIEQESDSLLKEYVKIENAENEIVKKLTAKAVSKMLDLVCPPPVPQPCKIKKELEDLIKQLNAQPTESELSDIFLKYDKILSKIALFSKPGTKKQNEAIPELSNQVVKNNDPIPSDLGTVGRLFADRLQRRPLTTGNKIAQISVEPDQKLAPT